MYVYCVFVGSCVCVCAVLFLSCAVFVVWCGGLLCLCYSKVVGLLFVLCCVVLCCVVLDKKYIL